MDTFPPETLLKSRPNPTRQRFSAAAFLVFALVGLAVAQCVQAQSHNRSEDSSSEQQDRQGQAVSLELEGVAAGVIALHYSRRFGTRWGGRVGFMQWTRVRPAVVVEDRPPSGFVGLPVGARRLFGGGAWQAEIGVSLAPGIAEEGGTGQAALWGGPSLGVRRQPPDGGLFLRATLMGTALVATGDTFAAPGIGIEIGYSF